MENASERGPSLRRVFSGRPDHGAPACSEGISDTARLTWLETGSAMIGRAPDPGVSSEISLPLDHQESVVVMSRLHEGEP